MKKFKTFFNEAEALQEKQIIYNNGKPYGQIVFLAGGAGSGKGFAITKFMEGNKFKVRDVDEWKKAFIKLNEIMGKYDEISGLNLKNTNDVFKLHEFVKGLKIKDKPLDLLLEDLKEDRLPNIIFDITFKDIDDISDVLPRLLKLGYESKNVHLTWVLANYRVAVVRNHDRERVVPDNILLKTHDGAARNMYDIVTGKVRNLKIDGQINVILNNEENTLYYTDKKDVYTNKLKKAKKNGKDGKNVVIKDFTYLRLKETGKPITKEKKVREQLYKWIIDNIPKSELNRDIFGEHFDG
jgi:dephospho-CoA kinase